MRENNRTWVITGASSGIGLALAEAALLEGENVVGTGRRLDRFEPLRARYPNTLLAVEHDVRDTAGAPAVIDAAMARFGKIDTLVNNAGVGQLGAAKRYQKRNCATCSTSTFTDRRRSCALLCQSCGSAGLERSCR